MNKLMLKDFSQYSFEDVIAHENGISLTAIASLQDRRVFFQVKQEGNLTTKVYNILKPAVDEYNRLLEAS